MFFREKRERKLMERVGMIKPTSKSALKQQCLYLSRLNVEQAEKMYNFLVKDMEELPAIDPANKSFIQNFGEQANGVIKWLEEHKDTISDGLNLIRSLRGKSNTIAAKPLPPIND